MYVNLRNPGFNPHRQYAFLRYDDEEVYLIVANFDNRDAEIQVEIPDLAFDMAQIAESEMESQDLLWGNTHHYSVDRANPVSIKVGAYDALILPLKKFQAKSSLK